MVFSNKKLPFYDKVAIIPLSKMSAIVKQYDMINSLNNLLCKKQMMKSIVSAMLILVPILMTMSNVSFADQSNFDSLPKNTSVFFCPDINAIKKTPEGFWTAEQGRWKSYGISLITTLSTFLGAQWNGQTVGQLTCVYRGKPASSFPLLLIFHVLALEPSGHQWQKNQGGYRNCASHDPKECPFTIRLKPVEKDPYEEAEQLKLKKDPLQNPGY